MILLDVQIMITRVTIVLTSDDVTSGALVTSVRITIVLTSDDVTLHAC